jgi:hypothetical protein
MKKILTLIAVSTTFLLSTGANANLNADGTYNYSNIEYCQYVKSIHSPQRDFLAKAYKSKFVRGGGDRGALVNSACSKIVKEHGRLRASEIEKLRIDVMM